MYIFHISGSFLVRNSKRGRCGRSYFLEVLAINEVPSGNKTGDEAFQEEEYKRVERLELEKTEAEKIEVEKLKAKKIEAERIEAEKIEAEKLKAEKKPL